MGEEPAEEALIEKNCRKNFHMWRSIANAFPALTSVCGLLGAADLECIKDMELPHYSFLARRSPLGGTVRAIVKIGQNGKANSSLSQRNHTSGDSLSERA